jgi:hypothetical protein
MSVPVGRRKQSRFEAQHHYLRLRSEITENAIEQAYKSWMGAYTKYMSKKQISNMKTLYKQLFGKEPRWKKT